MWAWLLDDIVNTILHDLYLIRLAIMWKWLILFYWKLSECDDVIWISISNVCMPGCRKLIPCTLNGDLQRKPTEYHGKHLQIQTKTTLWHIVWVARRPGEFGEICWKIVGGVCVWSFVGPQFSRQPSTGLRATKKYAQRRLVPYWEPPASFMAVGGFVSQLWRFSAIFCVERNNA